MTPEEMHTATATFIEAHRRYQAELRERCAEVEAQLAAMGHYQRTDRSLGD